MRPPALALAAALALGALSPGAAQEAAPCQLATLFDHLSSIQEECCGGNDCGSGYPGAEDSCSRPCGEGCEHIFGYGYPDCNGRNFVVRLSSNGRLWYDSWCVDEFRDGTDGTIRDGMNGRRTQWNHVVMTYESGSNTLSAYLNGELAKRGSPDSRPDTDTSDRHFFYVGQNQVWCTAKQR